ncbi:MAG: glycosyltransferase [Erysipelotrichaceae bacterium]|nr:glycosyltransferase [Erysipelotrichaceae bacterium]
MIFVTVGTHEQQFNRLVQFIDELKRDNHIKEDVVIQTGYCTYEPKYCSFQKLFPYDEMVEKVNAARIVITHGGPSSFVMPLRIGKIPIVVPRQKGYHEHVNDHQLEFCTELENRRHNIIVVSEIDSLREIIADYDKIVARMEATQADNSDNFNNRFKQIVKEMFADKS